MNSYLVGLQLQSSVAAGVVIPAPREARLASASKGTSISNPISALFTVAVPSIVMTGSVPARIAS